MQLTECEQTVVDEAVDQRWSRLKVCVHTKADDIEHLMW